MATQTQGPAPLSKHAVLRQAPKVGAVCGNSARTDLRGGTPARAFPTATSGMAVSIIAKGTPPPPLPPPPPPQPIPTSIGNFKFFGLKMQAQVDRTTSSSIRTPLHPGNAGPRTRLAFQWHEPRLSLRPDARYVKMARRSATLAVVPAEDTPKYSDKKMTADRSAINANRASRASWE
jgi:hypothetical protein